MAKKKIKKPAYIPKEERNKKPPMTKEQWIRTGAICAGVVLVIVLAFLLYDNGSIPMKKGELQGVSENWLVTNLNKQNRETYYKLAEVNAAPGFVVVPPQNPVKETSFTFIAEEDSESMADYYQVVGSAQKSDDMVNQAHAYFQSSYPEAKISEVGTGTFGELEAKYFSIYNEYEDSASHEEETPAEDIEPVAEAESPTDTEGEVPAEVEEEAEAEAPAEPETHVHRNVQFAAYFPSVRNSTVLVSTSTNLEEGEEIPSDEALLEQLQAIVENMKILQKPEK